MCGIVGYVGRDTAVDVIVDGLARLEYRGYDSAGIAVIGPAGIVVDKDRGKLRDLRRRFLDRLPASCVGVGHTRWATHGRPSDYNAHPHTGCHGRVAVVHNGIIENYTTLRSDLVARGHHFSSETDSEVLAHLFEDALTAGAPSLVEAVRRGLSLVHGAFAIAVAHADFPDRIVGARRFSPLVVALGEGENFLASDVMAVMGYSRSVVYLEDDEVVEVTRDGVRVIGLAGGDRVVRPVQVEWNPVLAEKGGFDHFMLKEIHEQPEVIRNTMGCRCDDEGASVHLDELGLSAADLRRVDRVVFVACGTAYYAGMVAAASVERLARIPASAEFASEFRYREPVLDGRTLVVAVSQSGETADTLAALRQARALGAVVAAIVNVPGSTIAREAGRILPIHAGPEIGVASTKAYTAMLAAGYLLALGLAEARETMAHAARAEFLTALRHVPQQMSHLLAGARDLFMPMAHRYSESKNMLFLGRGFNYPTALEGALKVKEISYIHAEGYAAGEMKHGPIALIEHDLPVVVIATGAATYDKVLSNMKEVKAREGRVIAVADEGDERMAEFADDVVRVPRTLEVLSPLVTIVPLQLLAYYIADYRGADVDQPRNLAKSVTVE